MMARYMRAATALLVAASIQGGVMLLAGAAYADDAVAPAPPVFDASVPIEGVWETAEKSEITIVGCPDDYCGSLTKIVVPPEELAKLTPAQRTLVAKMDPSQFPDARNQDESLRTRSLLGTQILTLHPGDGTTFKGKLYNPQDGKTYDGYVKLIDPNTIEVGGCVMNYCGNPIPHQNWTRSPDQDAIAAGTAVTPTTGAATAKPGKKPATDATAPAADPGGF